MVLGRRRGESPGARPSIFAELRAALSRGEWGGSNVPSVGFDSLRGTTMGPWLSSLSPTR